jgi:hypothetical protein
LLPAKPGWLEQVEWEERTYRLPLAKISAAQRAMGTKTATETIERALDLAAFQRALVDGTQAMFGVKIVSPDPDR